MKVLRQKAVSGWQAIRRANDFLLTSKRNKRLFIIAFILSCIVSQVWALDSWVFGQLTNRLVGQESIFTGVSLILAIVINVCVDIIPRTAKYYVRRLELRFRETATEQTQKKYWESYSRFDLQDRENPVLQNALNNASRNQAVVQEVFFIQWTLGISFLTVAVAASMLAGITWWYFFVVIAMIIPRMYFTRKRKVRNYSQEKQLNEINRYKGVLSDYIGTKESMLNASRPFYLGLFDSIRSKTNSFNYRSNHHFAAINYIGDIWYFLLFGGLLFSVTTKISNHEIAVGTMFVVFSSIYRMYTELDQATNSLVELEIASKKSEDFFLIVDTSPAIQDVSHPVIVDDTKPPIIEFENVYFKYPGSENYILKGVTFKIDSGETIGLIAKNGEGKTTIGLLLLRFYDPTEGSIRINGTDLRLVKRSSLLAITGALFQDFVTLKTTVKSSILACKPEKGASDFQIWQILEKVELKEYVEKLPQKLNQKVDRIYKDSVKLSGGQNQKLGLAGLLYRDPQMVVLDEFTSALDPEAEHQIVDQYRTLIKNKTALIISHRYLSLKIVDRIIVLHDGKIVENGKKDELMVINGGLFKKLYSAAMMSTSQN